MKLILISICFLFISCENNEKTFQFSFSRFGIVINSKISEKIEIKSEQQTIHQKIIGSKTLLSFKWKPLTQYIISINNVSYQINSPEKAEAVNIASIDLGNVKSYVKEGRSLDTDISISPSNEFAVIGTYTGKLIVYDLLNDVIKWEKSINEGVVKKVIFSDDSKFVFAGEQSMDGNIMCFNTETSEEVWSYALSDDLERSVAPRSDNIYGIYSLPGVFHMEFTDGKLLVAGVHGWFENGKSQKRSKLYQFSTSGEKIWEFPKKNVLYGNIQYFSSTNELIVFNIDQVQDEFNKSSPIKEQSIALLSATSGELLDQKSIPALPPHFPKVSFWQSVSLDKNNQFANMGTTDGRGFIFPIGDNTFRKMISLELGKPVIINEIPITAGIPYTNSFNGHAIYSVVQTTVPYVFSVENQINEPPALHPAAGTLFFYDENGEIVWKYHNKLIYSSVHASKSGEWFIATLDNKKENRDENQFGFTLFNYTNKSYSDVFHYQTEAPAFFRGAISDDGKLIGITETPFLENDKETVRGTYQVHIVM